MLLRESVTQKRWNTEMSTDRGSKNTTNPTHGVSDVQTHCCVRSLSHTAEHEKRISGI